MMPIYMVYARRAAWLGALMALFILNNLSWAQAPPPREEDESETIIERQKWFFEQRAYPLGYIPADARWKAFEHMKAKMGYQPERRELALEGNAAWTSIGPNNFGGRILAIAVHPTDPTIVYCGAADGGVWKSTDGGASWRPLTDTIPNLAVGSLAIDPRNPNTIYAGTGEGGLFSTGSAMGVGILKSTDGGDTWTIGPAFSRYNNALVIDPRNTQVIYAASYNGVFKSTDGNATWNRMLEGNAIDLVRDPNAPDTLYTGLWANPTTGTPGGIYKTTDGGARWTLLQNGLPPVSQIGRVALAVAPSQTRTLYAGIGTALRGPFLGMYKSTDGGDSWSLVFDAPPYCQSQCYYDNVLAVDPKNPDVIYAGGTPFYRSTDGGKSWSQIAGNIHVDYHAIVFAPADPRTIYVGNDGGMYKSTDDGANWMGLNNGLVTIQFYALGIAKSDPTLSLGGTQDNGTLRHNRGLSWAVILGGDGGFVAVDHDDSKVIYAESQYFNFVKSTDGGVTWRFADFGVSGQEPVLFVTPFVMDPQNAQVLYMGTNRLYKTSDGAGQWAPISPNLARRFGAVSAIGVSPSSTQTIYVGTSDGYLWRTDTGGEPWQQVISGLPNRNVTQVRVHPTNPHTAYATFSGFGSGHVFKTTDGGANWQDISSNLPDLPVNTIAIDPANPSALYMGTDLGVFRSSNDGGEWTPFNNGFPNVIVNALGFFGGGNLLRAATYGRGMFQILISANTPANVKPLSGTPQSTLASTTFATPMQALVTDSDNVPVPGVSVTFRAPASGPGGAFPDSAVSATVTADSNGVVQAPSFTANSEIGSYQVEAVVDGAAAPARFALANVSSGPAIQSVSPARAGFGQEIVIRGSNFVDPVTVTFFQQGNVFPLASSTIAPSLDGTMIRLRVPIVSFLGRANLIAGPSTLAVTANGVQSNPAAFEVAPSYTAPVITGLVPTAPSPGQRFMINLDGRLRSFEQVTVTQGDRSFKVPVDITTSAGVVVSLPEQGIGPGPAVITVANENSPASAAFAFNVPGSPPPINLRPISRTSVVIGQVFVISDDGNALAADADKNVIVFTQGERAIQAPAIGFSGVDLLVSAPEGLTAGSVSLQVKSTFPTGEVTSNSRTLQIATTPFPPALIRATPGIESPLTIFSPYSIPGGVVTLLSTVGGFNPILGNNTVFFVQGSTRLTGRALFVSSAGDRLDVLVPGTLSTGSVAVSATVKFNGVESDRSNTLGLSIISFFTLTGLQSTAHTLTVNTVSADRFSVRITGSSGQPLRGQVFFVAPANGPSGTFVSTGGARFASAISDFTGVATAPLFRANAKTGSYTVVAFVPGYNEKVELSVTNVSAPQSSAALRVPARGARTFQTTTNPNSIQVGYATVTASPAPAGAAIFGWQPSGTLLTEAGVGAAVPTRSALMFVDTRGSVNTGVALVNPNDQPATLNCTLYDSEGRLIMRAAERTLLAHGKLALFVNEPGLFGSMANNMYGTMLIESSAPIGSVSLRMTLSAVSGIVLTTLSVASAAQLPGPSDPPSFVASAPVFPHLVIGGSYDSQIILLNTESATVRGRIVFFTQNGSPLNIIAGANVQSYSIAANGVFFLPLTGGSDMVMGYAVIEPEAGRLPPAGSLILRSSSMGTVITEAGVGATRLTRESLIYAESTNTTVTGFAVANVNDMPATLTFTVYDADGTRIAAVGRTLPAHQQMAVPSVDELISSAKNLKGTLVIRSSLPVAAITLRGTTNQRGDLILTTLPVSDIANPASGSTVLFPHLALGGGFATEFIALGVGRETVGQLNLFSTDGQPLTLVTK